MVMDKIEQALQRARDTKSLIIGRGVVCRTSEMFVSLFPGQNAVVVADENTWEVAGRNAQASLDEAGVVTEKPYIFPAEDFYAEWQHIESLKSYLETVDAVAVAVGSGVINDTVKLVSHMLGRRYAPTRPR